MATLNSQVIRTVDIARHVGYSVQQIRNLERDGVLPPAPRTATQYRTYGPIHVHSALAYRWLAVAIGPVEAKRIVRAAHEHPTPELLGLLDAAHGRLDRERAHLRLAQQAAEAISVELIADVQSADLMSVSELADALGIRTSTLRHWDAEGLVVPDRAAPRGPRRYSPTQVRDARIVHQLRRAGYRIDTLRALIPDLARRNRARDVTAALSARDADIAARSLALLHAASELSQVLTLVADTSPDSPREQSDRTGA